MFELWSQDFKKRRPEKFNAEWDLNPDLCDTNAVLYQFSYQLPNWKLVFPKGNDNYYKLMEKQ